MTADNPQTAPRTTPKSDTKVALMCVGGVVTMVCAAYAAVPLYQMFCQVTGLGGTTQKAEKPSDVMLNRTVTVRFDSNVSSKLGWTFEPVQRTVEAHIGENMLVFYRATNTSDRKVTGTATFNVAPDAAGLFFSKIECFCFKEQTLEPGQSIEMPVSFFVDPSLVMDPEASRLKEITLSYTFYPVEGAKAAATDPVQVDTTADTVKDNRS
ncbi:MAG: cytochrome c oxidase assembly protein [Hyphomicrobium sp. 32-62-53]|nr:MAG: cytochrome c oxidase assembly protein [Hyphomicrobium sp. 12-62-95]OYX99379.1 MAG: cytochrome c oxidase assembly protein [Hyphomicrobium sp. 32-62-53]